MDRKGSKISIIGSGNVGATIAYTLTVCGTASEIVLVDVNFERAKGEAMDILQGTPFTHHANVYAGEFPAIEGSDIIILTAGAGRKPGQTRLDLAQTNVDIIKDVLSEIAKHAADAVIIVVSNPVDVITYLVANTPGIRESRVIGSGTILDTARLRTLLAEHVGLPAQNVHAYVLGEHGDSSMIPWSLTSIAGMQMGQYCEVICDCHNNCGKRDLDDIVNDMRTAGAKIIASKGATYYAIAISVNRLCDAVLRDTNSILTVSTMLHGQYGLDNVCVSLPSIISAKGIVKTLEVPLTEQERKEFIHSANTIKDVISALKI